MFEVPRVFSAFRAVRHGVMYSCGLGVLGLWVLGFGMLGSGFWVGGCLSGTGS